MRHGVRGGAGVPGHHAGGAGRIWGARVPTRRKTAPEGHHSRVVLRVSLVPFGRWLRGSRRAPPGAQRAASERIRRGAR